MTEIPLAEPDFGRPSERPLGVTIIAILQFIEAIILIFGGYTFLLVGAGLGYLGLGLLFGGVYLIIGIIGLIIGWGLWTLKGWAWMIAFLANIFSVIASLLGNNLASLIIPLIIVLYLFQGEVKASFGR